VAVVMGAPSVKLARVLDTVSQLSNSTSAVELPA
jgi:hypothetical protein